MGVQSLVTREVVGARMGRPKNWALKGARENVLGPLF